MVYENEDELGYWTYAQGEPSSLEVCNGLLSRREQADITTAADLAHRGYGFEAEDARRYANYHDVHHREDADGDPSGP